LDYDLLLFSLGEFRISYREPDEERPGPLEFPAADGSLFIDAGGQWIATRGGFEPCYCGSADDQPDHPLIVWDLTRGNVLLQLGRALDPLAQRHRLAAAFDENRILMLYASGEITQWDFSDPQARETLVAKVASRPVAASTLSWSADGSHLAFTGSYGGVDVYQTATGQLVQRFDPQLESPALSPDGELVALFDPETSVEVIYRVQDGDVLHTLPASSVLMGSAFSPDGSHLVYGEGSRASVLNLASGQVI
jgi:WD40 repeat protein